MCGWQKTSFSWSYVAAQSSNRLRKVYYILNAHMEQDPPQSNVILQRFKHKVQTRSSFELSWSPCQPSEVYRLSRSELSVILLGLDVADPFIKNKSHCFYEHMDLDRHQNNVVIHPIHAASCHTANILANTTVFRQDTDAFTCRT